MGKPRKTLEEFIEEATKIHNGKYYYNKTIYTSINEKVLITCPIHGDFWQNAGNHLQGYGCSICSGTKRKTTEEFIQQAKVVHGDKYDYSNVEYKNQLEPISIICPEHGEFWQTPKQHLKSLGCQKCARIIAGEHIADTKKEFIEKAKRVHGDKYDYSRVEYKNNRTKICIICPEHGEFYQLPDNHLNGSECPKCVGHYQRNTDDFIEEAKQIHGDRYDYSKLEYRNIHQNVCIICKKHGEFWQSPIRHLTGSNCPECVNEFTVSQSEKEFSEFVKSICKKDILTNTRKIITPFEIDTYIPELRLGFEYDGIYWHSTSVNSDNFHLKKKTELCQQQGVQLYHIYEDEWLYKRGIVESFVKRILGYPMSKISVVVCDFRKIESDETSNFTDNNTLIIDVETNTAYGLYFENVLQSVALVNETDDYIEIMGVFDRNETIVDGAFDRVVAELKVLHPSKTLYVRVDRRLDNTQKYLDKGFLFETEFVPDCYYAVRGSRIPKNNVEEFLENSVKVYKIYDCGSERLRLVD